MRARAGLPELGIYGGALWIVRGFLAYLTCLLTVVLRSAVRAYEQVSNKGVSARAVFSRGTSASALRRGGRHALTAASRMMTRDRKV